MYKLINGWTKAKVLEQVKKYNNGTQAMRAGIWGSREAYLGKIVTYKSQAVGMKDKPRSPVFRGFRTPVDMSE